MTLRDDYPPTGECRGNKAEIMDCIRQLDNKTEIQYLHIFQSVVLSDEFKIPEFRKTMLPALLYSLGGYLETNYFHNLKELGNSISLLLKTLKTKEYGCSELEIDVINSLLIQPFMHFVSNVNVGIPKSISSAYAALLRQINKSNRFQIFLETKLRKSAELRNFLELFFASSIQIIINYTKEQSINNIYLQCEVYYRFTEKISEVIFEKMFKPFSCKLFTLFTQFASRYVVIHALQIEKLSVSHRNRLVKRHGDCRSSMAKLIFEAWTRLGHDKARIMKLSKSRDQINKAQNEESYLTSYVNVSFVHDDELRKRAIELFYQMINYEIEQTSNIEQFEKEFLNIASILIVSGGKCDVRYVSLFQKLLHEWIAKNQKNNEKKIVFDNLIKRLSCGMKILLEYRDCDKNDEKAQVSCLINLAQFFYRCNRLDLYRNYLFKLYEVHSSRQSKIESSLSLRRIGQSLSFEDRPFSEEWSRAIYPQAITEAEVKELLCSEVIEALEDAKLYHHALEETKVLENYYDQLRNYEQLSDILKLRSSITSNLILSPIVSFSYFFVGFWGKSFPNSIQNISFIYRGEEFERYEDFCASLKDSFPEAEILNYTKKISDDIREQCSMKIQVYPVKPVVDLECHETSHFEHSRSYKNEHDANNIETRWVERRIFTTTDSFPTISTSNRIINVKSTNLKPIEVACDGILEKNKKLREMIQSHMKNDKDISQLGMILQGIIEPRVNGGYKIYENSFLSDESKHSIHEKHKLIDALASQIPLLERLLMIHEHQICTDLMPFHKSLEKSFQVMRKHFQDKYNRKDSFTAKNPVRCLRKLMHDPEGSSLSSSSSLRTQESIPFSKRTRPISWMDSSNTLASISNYGGSESSLTERGRRRRSKPREWFHTLLGSTSKINQRNSKEVVLREQVTPTRPRRPCSIPRSPMTPVSLSLHVKKEHVPVINNHSRQSQV